MPLGQLVARVWMELTTLPLVVRFIKRKEVPLCILGGSRWTVP